MYSNSKQVRSVADAVTKILNPQPEVVATEQLQEGWDDMMADVKKRNGPQPSGGSGIKQGSRYGGSKQKDEPEAEEKPKAKKKKPFSEMVSTYKETGLKSLQEWAKKKKAMAEEASNEEFTKEVKEAQAKSEGKGKKADVAKAAVQAVQNEETEQLDELSKTTLGNYVNAAKDDNKAHADSRRSGDAEESRWAKDRMVKRSTGMGAAKQRLNKEEAETVEEELKGNQHKIDKNKNNKIDAHDFKLLRKEDTHTTVEVFDFNDVNGVQRSTIELDERSLSPSEESKKEEIVKSMKKNISGFKERYGKDAKSVMYATATKNAKND